MAMITLTSLIFTLGHFKVHNPFRTLYLQGIDAKIGLEHH